MNLYTLGYIFNSDLSIVYLLRKKRPQWQRGLLNGIGGKVESGEGIYDSMVREAKEETGYDGIWNCFGEMGDASTWSMTLFYSVMDRGQKPPVTAENQEVIQVPICDIGRRHREMVNHSPMSIMAAIAQLNGEKFYLSSHFLAPTEVAKWTV